jgi:hypothetical protein
VAAVVGDGEAETGPLEGGWKGISFLNPVHDGAVLPILHLNGGKIAGPTVLARKDPDEVAALFTATATRWSGSRARICRGCTSVLLMPWPTATSASRRSRGRAERQLGWRASGLADDHPALTEGWTGPTRWTAKSWRAPGGSSGAAVGCAENPLICGGSRGGCARTISTSCSNPTARPARCAG